MRFLVATQPISGHVVPAVPIVCALIQRGHEVTWYTGAKFRESVEGTGARFAAHQDAMTTTTRITMRRFPAAAA